MKSSISTAAKLVLLLLCAALIACSDSNDNSGDASDSTAKLLAQFGQGAVFFSEPAMQALLDFEDAASPVTLLQVMSVTDTEGFARYEREMAEALAVSGAAESFGSRIFAQMIGNRPLLETRVLEFPSIVSLIDVLQSTQFATAMDTLFAATDDHAWTLGRPLEIPFEFKDSYFDPRLQGLNRQEAFTLLLESAAATSVNALGSDSDPENIVDMVVSDSPEPFYMVNLIQFYDMANYGDERDMQLTGREANDIYTEAVLPLLLRYRSGPVFAMDVDIVLTNESADWEQVAIARYASRDAFLNAFVLDPAGADALEHKDAGVEETLVYASEQRHVTPPAPVNGNLYHFRYCEILLVTLDAAGIMADVWGTQQLNRCPQELWDGIDRSTVASDFGVTAAQFNGPRFFVTDWISNTDSLEGGESVFFGDLEMTLLTTVEPGIGAGEPGAPYTVARVARNNVWHFVSGRRVYELENPEGLRYIMQSYSLAVDPALTLDDLENLGDRLELPPGWSFSSRVLLEPLAVTAVDGTAEVVQDELENTYQRIP